MNLGVRLLEQASDSPEKALEADRLRLGGAGGTPEDSTFLDESLKGTPSTPRTWEAVRGRGVCAGKCRGAGVWGGGLTSGRPDACWGPHRPRWEQSKVTREGPSVELGLRGGPATIAGPHP